MRTGGDDDDKRDDIRSTGSDGSLDAGRAGDRASEGGKVKQAIEYAWQLLMEYPEQLPNGGTLAGMMVNRFPGMPRVVAVDILSLASEFSVIGTA